MLEPVFVIQCLTNKLDVKVTLEMKGVEFWLTEAGSVKNETTSRTLTFGV
jgi:hypothetical protein